jgi:hypothetical protein
MTERSNECACRDLRWAEAEHPHIVQGLSELHGHDIEVAAAITPIDPARNIDPALLLYEHSCCPAAFEYMACRHHD